MTRTGYEDIFEKGLPDGWKPVTLKNVVTEIKNGFASGKRDENGIVQIRMNNVTSKGKLTLDSYLKVPLPKDMEFWKLKNGDFLFNNTNSYDLVGKSAVFTETPFPCTFSNHFTRIRFNENEILPEIVLHHFLILWGMGYFKSVAIRHVGQSAVHSKYLLNLKIPLPPIPEQKRIAEVLTTVDTAIQKEDEAIAKTERLKKGLMRKLLTEGIGHTEFKEVKGIGKIPKEWDVVKLGEALTLSNGQRPRFSKTGDIPVYGANGIMGFTDSFTVNNDYTIIIGRVGASGEVHLAEGKLWISDNAIYSETYNEDKIFPTFLHYLLIHRNLKQFASKTTHPIITQSFLKSFKIPLPPHSDDYSEQKRIAEILSTIDTKLDLERKHKHKLERIKKGLMNDLLTGKKRVRIGGV